MESTNPIKGQRRKPIKCIVQFTFQRAYVDTFTFVFAMVEWKLNILIPLKIKGMFLVENSNA